TTSITTVDCAIVPFSCNCSRNQPLLSQYSFICLGDQSFMYCTIGAALPSAIPATKCGAVILRQLIAEKVQSFFNGSTSYTYSPPSDSPQKRPNFISTPNGTVMCKLYTRSRYRKVS